jgi:K(+)-stimulated pyrophosphate-energized sodium pump
MVLAAIFFATSPLLMNMMTLPLAIGGAASHLDHWHLLRQAGANQSIMGALQGPDRNRRAVTVGVAAVIWPIGFGPLAGVEVPAWRCSSAASSACRRRLIIWITEYSQRISPGEVDRGIVGDRSRHQRDPGLAISMDPPPVRRW